MNCLDAPPIPDARLRRFSRGALIVEADRTAQTVYLVRQGQVRVYRLAETGHETTTAVLGPGQVFGIAPLLGQPVYHAFAEALTAAEVWALPADRLLEQLPDNLTLLQLIVESLGRRLTLAQALLGDVALLPVAQRIPDMLKRLEICLGGQRPGLTQDILAGLIGARRETVSRMMGAMAPAPALLSTVAWAERSG